MRSPSTGTPELRAEIAKAVPLYAPIAGLSGGGDSFQYGGRHYPSGNDFPTADGRAHFALVRPPSAVPENGDGSLALSTRRGKQFNSIVQESKDALTGATREAVMIAAADAERLGVASGQEVVLRSKTGELRCRVHLAPIAPGNAQVHWPEGNVLIADEIRSGEAGIPDYNTRVTIEAVLRSSSARARSSGVLTLKVSRSGASMYSGSRDSRALVAD